MFPGLVVVMALACTQAAPANPDASPPCGGAPELARQYRQTVIGGDRGALLALLRDPLIGCDEETPVGKDKVGETLRSRGSDMEVILYGTEELRRRPHLAYFGESIRDFLNRPVLRTTLREMPGTPAKACATFIGNDRTHEICGSCLDGRWRLYDWPLVCHLNLKNLDAAPSDKFRGGAWWQSAPPDEQRGYLAGYIDCAVWDGGLSRLGKLSWFALAPKVSARYAKRADTSTLLVSTVLKELVNAEPISSAGGGGEEYPGKHGFFDGEYWRQSQPEHRLGFIEGYVDCWRTEGIGGAQFSKPSGKYVDQLSDWFGINAGDPGVVRADRANTKIADALRSLRDN